MYLLGTQVGDAFINACRRKIIMKSAYVYMPPLRSFHWSDSNVLTTKTSMLGTVGVGAER